MTVQPFTPPGVLTANSLAGQTIPGALTVAGTLSGGPQSAPVLQLQATTGPTGFALVNGTPNILTWTAPNDGLIHRVTIISTIHVTSALTGGGISFNWFAPFAGSAVHTSALFAGGLGTDTNGQLQNNFEVPVLANTTVTVFQLAAVTVGAATWYGEIWGG